MTRANILIAVLIILAFSIAATTQVSRTIWHGDANITGDFDVYGSGGITGEILAATQTVEAATVVFAASDTQINVGTFTGTSDDNKVLKYTHSDNDFTPGFISLDEISDATSQNPSDNDVLTYNSGSGLWEPDTSSASVSNLADIGDVNLTGLAEDDLISYDGSNWVNTTAPTVDSIQFATTSPTASDDIGRLKWNHVDGTLEFALADGNVVHRIGEELFLVCANDTGNTISKGTAVAFTGVVSSNLSVDIVSATSSLANDLLGITAESITDGATGYVTVSGIVRNVSTSAFSGGDSLYLSESNPGELQTTVPTAPNHRHRVGQVVYSDASSGAIRVNVQRNWNLDNLDNVDTSGKSVDEVLYWTGTVWSATPQASGGASTLADLTDTAISSPASDEYLQYDGSDWVNSAFDQALNDLSNVAGSPSDNDVLTWDAGGATWQPEAASGGGGAPSQTFVVAANDSVNGSGADYTCDGIEDEVQINAALGAITNATGGRVLLLDGTYHAGSAIHLTTDGLTLQGQGRSTVIVRKFDSGSDEGVIDCSGDRDSIEIRDLVIDGNSGTYTNSNNYGISNGGAAVENSLFIDLEIYDCAGIGFNISGNPPDNVNNTIHGIHVNNSGDDGAYLSLDDSTVSDVVSSNNGDFGISLDNNQNVTLDSCISYGNTDDGFYSQGEMAECTVTNCISRSNVEGFDLDGTDVLLSACIAENNSSEGLYLSGDRWLITNSYFINNDNEGAELVSFSDDFRFIACVFSNNSDDGFRAPSGFNDDIHFLSCVFEDNGDNGIYFDDNNDPVILGCVFRNNTDTDLVLYDEVSRPVVKGNYFYQPNTTPLLLQGGDGAQIENNTFRTTGSPAYYPIEIEDSAVGDDATNYTLLGNRVVGDWPGEYTLDGQTIAPRQWLTLTDSPKGTNANTLILSASAGAKVGFATDTASEIANVIWVDPRATTNPIATSWDTHSDPALKKNIKPVENSTEIIDNLEVIQFDWRGKDSNTSQLSLDLKSLPDRLTSYGAEGNARGIKTSQVIMELVRAVQNLSLRLKEIEDAR